MQGVNSFVFAIITFNFWMCTAENSTYSYDVFSQENFTLIYRPRDLTTTTSKLTATEIISQDVNNILSKFDNICIFFNKLEPDVIKYIGLVPKIVAMKNLEANQTNQSGSTVPRYQICVVVNILESDYRAAAMTLLAASESANDIFESTVKVVVFDCNGYKEDLIIKPLIPVDGEKLIQVRIMNLARLVEESKYRYYKFGWFPESLCDTTKSLKVINSLTIYIDKVIFQFESEISITNINSGAISKETAVRKYENCRRFCLSDNSLCDLDVVTKFRQDGKTQLYNDCYLTLFWAQDFPCNVSREQIQSKANTSIVMYKTYDEIHIPKNFYYGWWHIDKNKNLVVRRTTNHLLPYCTDEEDSEAQTSIQINSTEPSAMFTTPVDPASVITSVNRDFIIAAIATGMFLLIATATFIYLCFKKRMVCSVLSADEVQNFKEGKNEMEVLESSLSRKYSRVVPVSLPYDKETYELQPKSFKIQEDRILGEGAHGRVYRALLFKTNTSVPAAAKTVKDLNSVKAKRKLLSEIKVLAYLGAHENILKLLGAHTGSLRNGNIIVFTELCALGSLEKLLRTYKENLSAEIESYEAYRLILAPSNIPSEVLELANINNTSTRERHLFEIQMDMKRWSYEISNGMEYLVQKSVVHADLATRNILITDVKQAKIADFGLSRRLYNFNQYVKTHDDYLPWRWMAPEALKNFVFNEKTDVWAFGVTIWEIFTLGEIPFPEMRYNKSFVSDLVKGVKPESPHYNLNDVYELMQRCWKIDPDARPNFVTIKLDLIQRFQSLEEIQT